MAKLSKSEVEHIANLARIKLSKQEVEKFQKQLSVILDYIEKLGEIDTTDVEPTAQVTGLENVLREDKLVKCNEQTRKEILNNFPDHEDDYLRVPKVF